MKALFFDMDGTLIDSYNGHKDIPVGVINELKRIQSLGHKLFISSGRPKAMMKEKFLTYSSENSPNLYRLEMNRCLFDLL